VRDRDDRHPLIDGEAVPFEPNQLARIVGDGTDRLQPKIEQDLRTDPVVAEVGLESESLVCLDRVAALILELVGLELVEQSDSSTFLIEVDDQSLSFLRDHPQRGVELPAAIAAQGMEYIAREALGVHAHQYAVVWANVTKDEGDVLMLVDVVAVTDDAPRAAFHRKTSFGDPVHETLRLEPVCDELSDRNESQAVLLREPIELGPAGARAVFAQDLTNHSGGHEAREPCEIYSCLRVSDALEHPTLTCAQRRYVSRSAQVSRNRLRINGDTDCLGSVLCAHSGGDAKALVGIDADSERGAVFVGILFGLLSQLELVGALSGQREADPSTRLADHEVDHLGRDKLRRANEIAFVLAILIIRNDDQLARLDVGDGLLDCSESHVS